MPPHKQRLKLKSRSLKSRSLKSRSLKSRSLKSRLLKSRSLRSRLLRSRLLRSRLLRSRLRRAGTTEAAVAPVPSLTITKDADKEMVSLDGETITYTITVANTGTSTDDRRCGGRVRRGATLASGDENANEVLETTETWVYNADYDVTKATLKPAPIS